MISDWIEQHSKTLTEAISANSERTFFAHWPEPPSGKIYGETANADGEAAFKEQLNKAFELPLQQGSTGTCGEEASPYGFSLGISYPSFTTETLVTKASNAGAAWSSLAPIERASILIEALERASKRFFEIGYATVHTTGQGFVMAFQSSGPHGFDRALEALALGYAAQVAFKPEVLWSKPMGKMEVSIKKKYRIVPKGINVVIGCSTFPVWNSTPGIFAGLVTGNAVIVKPHPSAIYPIAIVVAELQRVLAEAGLDPHIIQLAPDTIQHPITLDLIHHPAVGVIDYTGGPVFGNVVEREGAGKVVFTEKAGVNCVIVDSVSDIDKAFDNLAFALSLYSGQMCTAPQNIFIPSTGVSVNGERISVEDAAIKLREKIDALVGNEKSGPGTLGAIQNEATLKRVEEVETLGLDVVRAAARITHPGFDAARSMTPTVLRVGADRSDIYTKEWFGPISFIITTDSYADAVRRVAEITREKGALTTLVYTTDESHMQQAEDAIIAAGAPVAFNFDSFVWVNQSAAFSDLHGSGANPAGNASFADWTFVTSRFNVIGVRTQA